MTARGVVMCMVAIGSGLWVAKPAWAGDYHMLETEDARTVGDGNLRTDVEVGVTKQNDASELYHVPRVRAEYGLSEWADLEFEYEALSVQGTDIPNYKTSPPTVARDEDGSGSGDLRVRLKLVPFETERGNVGFHFETKLPNADNGEGLGTDSTDFTARLLYTGQLGELLDAPVLREMTVHANVGLAVIAQPSRNQEQNDYVLWGLGAEYPLTDLLTLMGEVEGAVNGDEIQSIAEGSESKDSATARLALTGPVGQDWTWGVAAAKGLTTESEDWEVLVGLSRFWGIDYERPPARNASPEMRWTDPGAVMSYYNPLWTEEAQTLGERRFRGEVEFDYTRQASGSDLYQAPRAVLGWGVGPWAEFELEGAYLYAEDVDVFTSAGRIESQESSVNGPGDVRVHLKLVPWRFRIGDVGVKFTTKLPLADDDEGLGTDETDFVVRTLLSSNWGSISSNAFISRLTTHVNAGVAIQEDPFRRQRQDDIFLWGVAAEYALTDEYAAWLELYGASGGQRVQSIAEGDYGDDQLTARLALTGPLPDFDLLPDYELFRGWKWSAAVAAGLTNDSPEYAGKIGFSHTWGLE